jgi:hypothetical protein
MGILPVKAAEVPRAGSGGKTKLVGKLGVGRVLRGGGIRGSVIPLF